VGVALAICLYRTGIRIGYDSYYYCEFAKTYATEWPHAFGNHWPCGFPLLGGLLGRLGLPAYPALTLVSLAALGVLTTIAARWVPRTLSICAMAATPIIGVQLFGVATELPFAAALLGLAAAIAAWPKPSALWSAAACAVAALGLRYAGVVAFGVLWAALLIEAPRLHAARRLIHGAVAVVSATLAALGLLLWNLAATGHLSGADRLAPEGLGMSSLPGHLADIGWSLPSALMLGGLRDRMASGLAGQGIGWIMAAGCGILCAWAALRPRLPWVRACALVALVYGVGMVVLRSVGSFDALYNARTFLPVIFPLGLVLAAQLRGRSAWVVPGVAAILLLAGLVSAGRGISRQIGGDVQAAVPILQSRLHRGDSVQVNDFALSLSAMVPQRVFRAWPEYWYQNPRERFLVVAAKPVDHAGTPGEIDPVWRALCDQLVARGTHEWLLRSPGLLILEQTTPP
jgi:hypothetical protein